MPIRSSRPAYFACLTYKFATSRMRYRRLWQAPIFFYNNVWEVPAPLRLSNSLGGLNQLVKLTRKYAIRFPQSTYSLSLRMADEVGYWDPDIISEDWHMMLKCFFLLNGNVNVEPIFLAVGNDGVRRTDTSAPSGSTTSSRGGTRGEPPTYLTR